MSGRRQNADSTDTLPLRDVAMAINFGTKTAINWLCVDDSDLAIGCEGGLSGRRQNADIADTLHLRDVSMATTLAFDGL